MYFIKKIWNGELPLVKVYWLYGFLVGVLLSFLIILLKNYPLAIVLLTIILIPYHFLILTGIWRSASNYTRYKLWAVLAKIAVIFGALVILSSLINLIKVFNSDTYKYSEQNLIKYSPIREKLGSNWQWRLITNHWWIVGNDFPKNKYGMVNVWVKVEALPKAKELGTAYSHSIVNVDFSCTDKTYKIISFTDVFSDNSLEDRIDPSYAGQDFVTVEENGRGLVTVYHYVCG